MNNSDRKPPKYIFIVDDAPMLGAELMEEHQLKNDDIIRLYTELGHLITGEQLTEFLSNRAQEHQAANDLDDQLTNSIYNLCVVNSCRTKLVAKFLDVGLYAINRRVERLVLEKELAAQCQEDPEILMQFVEFLPSYSAPATPMHRYEYKGVSYSSHEIHSLFECGKRITAKNLADGRTWQEFVDFHEAPKVTIDGEEYYYPEVVEKFGINPHDLTRGKTHARILERANPLPYSPWY